MHSLHRWAAYDHTSSNSCKLRTRNWGNPSYRSTKIEQQNTGKTFAGLIRLDFWCNFCMVGSEFGSNKTWKLGSILSRINSSSWQWWFDGMGDIFFAVPPEHHATVYLSIVANFVHSFLCSSSDARLYQNVALLIISDCFFFFKMNLS